jgi:hypothetical protein
MSPRVRFALLVDMTGHWEKVEGGSRLCSSGKAAATQSLPPLNVASHVDRAKRVETPPIHPSCILQANNQKPHFYLILTTKQPQ